MTFLYIVYKFIKNMKIQKFRNFLNESINNVDILEKMSKYITRRFKDEDRIIFTYWIGKIFVFSKFLFISNVEMSEDFKDVKHVFVIIGDKYYDGSGFYTRDEIYKLFHISKWSFNDYTFSGNMEDLSKCVENKKLKLSEKLENELKLILQKYKDMI